MTGVEILSSETIYNTILPECWLAIGVLAMFVFFRHYGVAICNRTRGTWIYVSYISIGISTCWYFGRD